MGLSISLLNNSLRTSLDYLDQGVVSRASGADALNTNFIERLVSKSI